MGNHVHICMFVSFSVLIGWLCPRKHSSLDLGRKWFSISLLTMPPTASPLTDFWHLCCHLQFPVLNRDKRKRWLGGGWSSAGCSGFPYSGHIWKCVPVIIPTRNRRRKSHLSPSLPKSLVTGEWLSDFCCALERHSKDQQQSRRLWLCTFWGFLTWES